LRAVGRRNEALAQILEAKKLEPQSPVVERSLAMHYYYAQDYPQAIEIARRLVAAYPSFAAGYLTLGLAYEQAGRSDEAIAALEKAARLSDNNSMHLGALAHAYGRANREAEARHVLQQMLAPSRDYVSAYDVALVYHGLKDKTETLRSLNKACDDRAIGLRYLRIDPRFEDLRSEPEFQVIQRRIGLSP
jgi:tetratricopeptide (TPR) repeat protein